MAEVVVQVDQLGKRYQVAQRRGRHDTLRDALTEGVRGMGRRLGEWFSRRPREEQDSFWALRDVSFEVKRGEVLGLIGRNGAGKSTLLKLLSRITEPTRGRLALRGRVSSLLEVGTGFHPELTGRENIYLNGAILGMKRAEIKKKFDEIVAFAEVEQFLEMPVKRYSSGMYVRLAFAVAAHLEPEILMIDEVLAVGDVGFQRKCMGRMSAVAKEHRTVLFVSHNMSAVRSLCTRGIILERGRVTLEADSATAADAYVNANTVRTDIAEAGLENRIGRTNGAVRFTAIRLEDDEHRERASFHEGETIRIVLSYQAYRTVPDLGLHVQILAPGTRECVTSLKTVLADKQITAGDKATVCLTFPSVPMRPGDYPLYICLGSKDCERFYDVIDANVSLPHLSITSEENDTHRTMGCFSIPWRLTTEQAGARQ